MIGFMCLKELMLPDFRPMFHLQINQEIGFTSRMFEKHLWKTDILSKDAGIASKNELPGFYISGTLVENGLIKLMNQANGLFVIIITFFKEVLYKKEQQQNRIY